MFRIFFNGLWPMRQTPTLSGTSTLGFRFAGSFPLLLRTPQKTSIKQRQVDFSWRLSWLKRPNICSHSGKSVSGCQPSIINIFFTFPFTTLLLFYHLQPALTRTKIQEGIPQADQPTSTEAVELPSCLAPTVPEGFVHVGYAVDALMQAVDIQVSALWCQQLILSDLSEDLFIVRYGGTYLCCKALVDAMDWHQ